MTRCRMPKESCADSPEVSLQLLDPSEWRLTACGGLLCEGNIIILEARSIFCAVRNAESMCPLGRFFNSF